jgi:cbb3-type cytochrome oxidase subunit 3
MDAHDILIGLLTAFLLAWFAYILLFIARKLFGWRNETKLNFDEAQR